MPIDHLLAARHGLALHAGPVGVVSWSPPIPPPRGLTDMGELGQGHSAAAGTEWLVPKSPVAFHSLGLLPVCIPF